MEAEFNNIPVTMTEDASDSQSGVEGSSVPAESAVAEKAMTPSVLAELQAIQKALKDMQANVDAEGNNSDLEMADAQKELDQAIADIDKLKLKIGSKEKTLRQQAELREKRASAGKGVALFGRSKPKKYQESFDKAQMEVAILQSQLDQVAADKEEKERMLQMTQLTRPEKQIESLEQRRETLLLQVAPQNDNVLQLVDTRQTYIETKAKVDALEKAEKLLLRALSLSKRAGAYMEQHIRLSMTEGAANATQSISKKADVAFLVANTASISSLSGSINDLRSARSEANQSPTPPQNQTQNQTNSPTKSSDRFTVEPGVNLNAPSPQEKELDATKYYRRAVQFNYDGGYRALRKVQTLYAEAEEKIGRSGCLSESDGEAQPGLVQNLLQTGLLSLDRSLAVREKREEELLRQFAVSVPAVPVKDKANNGKAGKKLSMQINMLSASSGALPGPGTESKEDIANPFPSVVVDSPRNKITSKFKKGHRRARSDMGGGVGGIKDLVMPVVPKALASESNPDLTTSAGFVVLPEADEMSVEGMSPTKDAKGKDKDRPKSDGTTKKKAGRSMTDASVLPRTQAAGMNSSMVDKQRGTLSHNTLSLPEPSTSPLLSVSEIADSHTHEAIPEVDELNQSHGSNSMAASASLPVGGSDDHLHHHDGAHRRNTSAMAQGQQQLDTPAVRRTMGSVSGSVSNAVIGDGMAAVIAMQPALEKELVRVRSVLKIEREKLTELQPTYRRRRSTLMHAVAEEVIRKGSMTKQQDR